MGIVSWTLCPYMSFEVVASASGDLNVVVSLLPLSAVQECLCDWVGFMSHRITCSETELSSVCFYLPRCCCLIIMGGFSFSPCGLPSFSGASLCSVFPEYHVCEIYQPCIAVCTPLCCSRFASQFQKK
eukprot:RCo052983